MSSGVVMGVGSGLEGFLNRVSAVRLGPGAPAFALVTLDAPIPTGATAGEPALALIESGELRLAMPALALNESDKLRLAVPLFALVTPDSAGVSG